MHDMRLLEEVLVPVSRPQRRVLIVAQQIELRARIARVLQSAGHTVELAGSRIRALELAAGKKIEAAIIVRSSDLNGLGQELREQVPRTIILDLERTRSVGRNILFVGPTCLRKNSTSRNSSISSENR